MYVREMLRLEGVDSAHSSTCSQCLYDHDELYRCVECFNSGLTCRECIVSMHTNLPFHRIQVSNTVSISLYRYISLYMNAFYIVMYNAFYILLHRRSTSLSIIYSRKFSGMDRNVFPSPDTHVAGSSCASRTSCRRALLQSITCCKGRLRRRRHSANTHHRSPVL